MPQRIYCFILGDYLSVVFPVTIGEVTCVNGCDILFENFNVAHLKDSIWELRKDILSSSNMDLWKVEIKGTDEIIKKLKNTEIDIKIEFEGVKLSMMTCLIKDIFLNNPPEGCIHIIVQPLPTTTATGQKRQIYPGPPESKRQKILFEPFNFDEFVTQLFTKITINSPPQLYPESKQGITGRFRKDGSCIPISGKNYPDMRLNDKYITNMGQKLVESCKNKEQSIQLLYAVSGAGKTRAIFDMAMHKNGMFITYVECRPSSGKNNIILEPIADHNFAQLVNLIGTLDINTARAESKHFIILEFTARVFFLILLKKKFEKLTPCDYLLAQINEGQNSIADIKDELKCLKCSDLIFLIRSALKYLKDNLLSQIGQESLIFAIDRANIASKLFYGQFLNYYGKPCGTLTQMLEILKLFEVSMVIAGTAFSLNQESNIQSGIGKGQVNEYLIDFTSMASEDVKTYIMQYLDLKDCDIDIENWKYLIGRPHLAAHLVVEIIHAEQIEQTKQNQKSKQAVFETAVNKTVQVIRNDLKTHLERIATDAYEKNDYSNNCLKDVLEFLFVNCWFFGGHIPISDMSESSLKLVECGIASLMNENSKKYVIINELLVVETVNTVLASKYYRPTQRLLERLFEELRKSAALGDNSNTSKGIMWQYLVIGKLMEFNNTTVFEFVNKIYDNKSQLPEWTKKAIINIKSYGNLQMFFQRLDNTLKDDVEVIQKFLHTSTFSEYMLVPGHLMRPDGVYIGKCNRGTYWTILISAKMYTNKLSGEEIDNDKQSTNWNLVYHKKDGDINLKCDDLRQKLDDVRKDFNHQGSLRIHFILPGVTSKNRGGCHVESNDIIVYIDETLIERYFADRYASFLMKIFTSNN